LLIDRFYEKVKADKVIGYIVTHHHFYVKQALPNIYQRINKVATKHGDRFPYMIKVLELFTAICADLNLHMEKEERVLFPHIKELYALSNRQDQHAINANYIEHPIHVMEAEHEHVGNLLHEIRRLTNNYTAPDNACTTFRVCLAELKEFEEDLHQHVHLENNILFPVIDKIVSKKTV